MNTLKAINQVIDDMFVFIGTHIFRFNQDHSNDENYSNNEDDYDLDYSNNEHQDEIRPPLHPGNPEIYLLALQGDQEALVLVSTLDEEYLL